MIGKAVLPVDEASAGHESLSREELREVLNTALRAGQIMLENGANTSRVEETVHHIGTGLGAEWMDIYVTPQGILATAVSHGEHRTRILRVTKSGVDLSRMDAVIDVSRRIDRHEIGLDQARADLDTIASQPRRYKVWQTTLAVGVACAAFAVLFGGGFAEFVVVLIAASVAQYLRHTLLHHNLDRLMTTAIVAAFSSGLALFMSYGLANLNLARWLPGPLALLAVPATALAASVLLLVPGVPLVSGTADLFRGDIVSGTARATAALLAVMSIGVGVWAMLLVTGARVVITTATQPNLLLAMAMALLAAGGFAVLFDVPGRALPLAALAGMAAVAVRNSATLFGGFPIEVAAFLSGLTIGALAELLARWLRVPSSLFAIPGYIPLVPGVPAFRAVLGFVNDNYLDGLADVVRATLIIVAIAVGLGTVSAIVRLRQKPIF